MATMTKRKHDLKFEGECIDGAPGLTMLVREPDGGLAIGYSEWADQRMTLSPSQAVAIRKWLEATEKCT